MVLTFRVVRDGMVILLEDGVRIANFGSHCRTDPTGEKTPCYFDFREACEMVHEVCEEGDDLFAGLSELADEIKRAYEDTFDGLVDKKGRVAIPEEYL